VPEAKQFGFEQARDMSLSALAVKVTDGFFVVGLSTIALSALFAR
jgi:hypothetical protein